MPKQSKFRSIKDGRALETFKSALPFVAPLVALVVILGVFGTIASRNDSKGHHKDYEFMPGVTDDRGIKQHAPATTAEAEGLADAYAKCRETETARLNVTDAGLKLCVEYESDADGYNIKVMRHPGFLGGAVASPVEIQLRDGKPYLVFNAGKAVIPANTTVRIRSRVTDAGGKYEIQNWRDGMTFKAERAGSSRDTGYTASTARLPYVEMIDGGALRDIASVGARPRAAVVEFRFRGRLEERALRPEHVGAVADFVASGLLTGHPES